MKEFLSTRVMGAMNIVNVVVGVAIATALIPVIVTFVAEANNLTTTETTLLNLLPLFIIIALVFGIYKTSGLKSA